jgi:hypothetical protein
MMSTEGRETPVEGEDFYREGEFIVFTREFHLKRGQCCGSGCRHCPYEPRWTKGVMTVAAEESQERSDHLRG